MTPEEARSRKALYWAVERDRLSPADADAQLIENGQGPFQRRPDLLLHDPMQDDEWTLPMAAAWFIWRSEDAVRDQWNPARMGWRKWVHIQKRRGVEPPAPGWKLKNFGRATLADVFSQFGLPTGSRTKNAAIRGRIAPDHVHTPYSRLRDALGSGRLRATWGKRIEDDFEEIVPEYWRRKFDGISNPRKPTPEKSTAALPSSTAETLVLIKSTKKSLQTVKMPPTKKPTINFDELEVLPDLSLGEALKAESQKTQSKRREGAAFHYENTDVFVRREDVISIERDISQAEYEPLEWDLGQTLGWIAYQKQGSFRSLWKNDLNPRPTYYGEVYSPQFAVDDPVRALKENLLSGMLVGYQDGEAIPSVKWIGSEVWDHPRTVFTRASIIKLWKELPSAAPPKKLPRASKEKMTDIHERLNAERGGLASESAFIAELRECGFDPNVRRAREFRVKYAEEKGISFEPGPRGPRKPRPNPI